MNVADSKLFVAFPARLAAEVEVSPSNLSNYFAAVDLLYFSVKLDEMPTTRHVDHFSVYHFASQRTFNDSNFAGDTTSVNSGLSNYY